MDDAAKEAFVNKVDEFAATLNPAEQAMLMDLLSDDGDDVAGFGLNTGWPGLTTLAPRRLDEFGQSGGDPKILRAEPDYTTFTKTGGGSDI